MTRTSILIMRITLPLTFVPLQIAGLVLLASFWKSATTFHWMIPWSTLLMIAGPLHFLCRREFKLAYHMNHLAENESYFTIFFGSPGKEKYRDAYPYRSLVTISTWSGYALALLVVWFIGAFFVEMIRK